MFGRSGLSAQTKQASTASVRKTKIAGPGGEWGGRETWNRGLPFPPAWARPANEKYRTAC